MEKKNNRKYEKKKAKQKEKNLPVELFLWDFLRAFDTYIFFSRVQRTHTYVQNYNTEINNLFVKRKITNGEVGRLGF